MDLLQDLPRHNKHLGEGAWWLPQFADPHQIYSDIQAVSAAAPFRTMTTAAGRPLSVAMTNCGTLGWISDRLGYRYVSRDPLTDRSWPPLPSSFRTMAVQAAEAAGFAGFDPDCCLINRYAPGARLGLHQDRDERDFDQPIVSVSIGLACNFVWGGALRTDETKSYRLESGDVVVFGGPARLNFHGVAKIHDGTHPLTGALRFNLTFRRSD